MKEKSNNKQYRIAIGSLILLAGLILEAFTNIDKIITITLITAGTIIILISVYHHLKYREKGAPTQDEWSRKISTASLANSWFVTFIVMIILFWVNYFNWIQFNVNQTIGLLFFTMILTANIFQLYFKKRGDVE